jgi:hypothetical protein
MVNGGFVWGVSIGRLFMSRLAELMVPHKPGEGLALTTLAMLLSPLVRSCSRSFAPTRTQLIGVRTPRRAVPYAEMAALEADRGLLQGAHPDAEARDGTGLELRVDRLGVPARRPAGQVLRQGGGGQRRDQEGQVRGLLRGRAGAGRGRRRGARRGERRRARHRLPRRRQAEGDLRLAEVQGDGGGRSGQPGSSVQVRTRNHVAHLLSPSMILEFAADRFSVQAVRAPADPADGGHRLLGQPVEHIRLRDDGQVGGAPPRRRLPAARRRADGEERGGVGRVRQRGTASSTARARASAPPIPGTTTSSVGTWATIRGGRRGSWPSGCNPTDQLTMPASAEVYSNHCTYS